MLLRQVIHLPPRGFKMLGLDVGPSAFGPIFHARQTLTSAQILASNTNPITIVPAPGPGNIIVPIEATMTLNFNTTAYTSAGSPSIYYAENLTTMITGSSFSLTGTVSSIQGGRALTAGPWPLSTTTNNSVVFFTPTSNPTVGDGTVDIDIWFTIVKV
jgi:hypothetical protein